MLRNPWGSVLHGFVGFMIAEASHRIRIDNLVLTGDLPLPFWPDWQIMGGFRTAQLHCIVDV